MNHQIELGDIGCGAAIALFFILALALSLTVGSGLDKIATVIQTVCGK